MLKGHKSWLWLQQSEITVLIGLTIAFENGGRCRRHEFPRHKTDFRAGLTQLIQREILN